MPPRRSVRRYNRGGYGGGAIRHLARGVGFAWRNRRAVQQAGRAVGKGLRKWWNTASSSTTTGQRDVRSERPPKKKRVNKGFSRKVDRVVASHAGRNTVLFNGPVFAQSSTAGTQAVSFFTIFGSNGTTGQYSDLSRLLQLHEDAADVENARTKICTFTTVLRKLVLPIVMA